jgi:hypothetical protein
VARYEHRILVGKPAGRRPLEGPACRYGDITTYLYETAWLGAGSGVAVVSTVMNCRVP